MELMQQQQANDARLREQERRHQVSSPSGEWKRRKKLPHPASPAIRVHFLLQDDIERLKERLDTAMQSLRDQQTQQATVAAV